MLIVFVALRYTDVSNVPFSVHSAVTSRNGCFLLLRWRTWCQELFNLSWCVARLCTVVSWWRRYHLQNGANLLACQWQTSNSPTVVIPLQPWVQKSVIPWANLGVVDKWYRPNRRTLLKVTYLFYLHCLNRPHCSQLFVRCRWGWFVQLTHPGPPSNELSPVELPHFSSNCAQYYKER